MRVVSNDKLTTYQVECGYIYPPTPADARGSAPGNKTFEDIWPSTTTTATTTTTTTTITTTTTMQAAAGSSRQQAAVSEYWQKTRLDYF